MKSIDPAALRTSNNTHYTPRRFKRVVLVSALLLAVTAMVVPFDSVHSNSRGNTAGQGLVQWTEPSISMLSFPWMAGESVTLYAADCVTPRSDFNLGEVVCAKTDGVDLSVPNNHYMNWIDSQLNSTNGGTITQNPQFFLFTPTTADTWKATIGSVTPDDSSIIGNPPLFTVSEGVGIATYAADCTTPKTTFSLGDTVCAKVTGGNQFNRRFAWVDPAGITRTFTSIIADPQTDAFTLPTTETSTIDIFVVDNRGQWQANVVSSRGTIVRSQPFLVQGATPTADLSVTKSLVGEAPESGQNLTFAVAVTNKGPNPAENVTFSDAEPGNASFVSVTQTSGPAFSCTGSNPVVCTRGTTTSPLFLNPGETAVFELVYTANGANGSSITNAATVESETFDLNEVDNTDVYTVVIGGGGGTPADCVLNCPPSLTVATNTTQGGNPGAIVTFGDANANGDCGTVTASPASGSFFPVGTTTVTLTSSVGGGSCSFAVTVIDEPSPTITCPANQTVEAPSGQPEATVSVGTPSATGSNVVIGSSRSDERPVSDPYPVGTTTITWSATDEFDRQAFCVQTIVVTSDDTPTISCPTNKTFNATNGCSYTATAAEIGTPVTGGAPSPPGESCPVSAPCAVRNDGLTLADPFPAGQTTITWTATNAVGSASCTQIITVIGTDTTAPTLTTPANIVTSTDQCSILLDDELFGATAEDDGSCGSSVTISRTGIPRVPCPVPGDPTRTCESFVFPTGTTVVTYTATDASGNSTSGTQTVTVNESPNVPPTITAPADLTGTTAVFTGPGATSCGTFISDATLGTATANDNCAGVVVTRIGVPAGNIFPVGDTVITYRATDRVGNFTEDTQTVTVIDNTPPVVTPPPNITVFLPLNTTDTSMVVNYPTPATATDNCPGTLNITYSPASGSVFPVGTTTVTASTTDAHGNTGSATFTVTVLYNFTGFFQPVDNLPTLNVVNAGKAIPVKFSLSGNKGLNIFAANSPYTISINCDGSLPQNDIEETVNAGGSSLSYNASSDQYNYVWKTENQWKNTCRQLVVVLNDGSEHRANFKFK
ncbi:MAG TPA: PxKF domain-containing protein [Pyrinomonadaceae bacterium]